MSSRDLIADALYIALCEYQCAFTKIEDDGGPMPLVDLISPHTTIAEGKEELSELAGALADVVMNHIEAEQARWQERIRDITSAVGDFDGSGTDTGDPLDVTAAEVWMAIQGGEVQP